MYYLKSGISTLSRQIGRERTESGSRYGRSDREKLPQLRRTVMRRQTDPGPGHPPLKAAPRPHPRRFFFCRLCACSAAGVWRLLPRLTLCRLGWVLPFVSWATLGLVAVRPSSLALFRPGSVLGVRGCVRPGRLFGLARLWRRPPLAVHGLRP